MGENMIRTILCVSFIILCLLNISLLLLGYYYQSKTVKRFESMRKKEIKNEWRKL